MLLTAGKYSSEIPLQICDVHHILLFWYAYSWGNTADPEPTLIQCLVFAGMSYFTHDYNAPFSMF